MWKIIFNILAVTVMATIPLNGYAREQPSPTGHTEFLPEGSNAPLFKAVDQSGQTVDLANLLGKGPVVINFWSIYCDSCVDEMISLQKLEDKYRGEGLSILAVNEDIRISRDRIRRFLERLERFRGKVTYPLLFDEDSAIFKSYLGNYLPTLVLIDRNGKIVSTFRGYTVESEPDVLAKIESLVSTEIEPAREPPSGTENIQVSTVTGSASLCGFFDGGKWKRSFTGNDSFAQEVELTRELARRDATREAILNTLNGMGIKLFSNKPMRGCIDDEGIHLDRDPLDTGDPASNILNLLSYSDFFTTADEQEKLVGNDYFVTRTVRADVADLAGELTSLGYLFTPMRIEFTYVNMTSLDQKEFLGSLLRQSRFIGTFENPVITPYSTSQVFEVYTSSQGFADEILEMDFSNLQVFVEQVTPSSLELEIWKKGE